MAVYINTGSGTTGGRIWDDDEGFTSTSYIYNPSPCVYSTTDSQPVAQEPESAKEEPIDEPHRPYDFLTQDDVMPLAPVARGSDTERQWPSGFV